MVTLMDNEMSLCEEIDLNALQIIRDNLDELYDNGKLGRFKNAKAGYCEITDKATIKTIIDEFYQSKKKSNITEYRYSRGIKWGRMFSTKASLQSSSKVIRHTIAKDIYVDVDIVNCHMIILKKYCQDNKIDTPFLDKYITKREDCLKELMAYEWSDDKSHLSRDDAKEFMLSIINGGIRTQKFENGSAPDWIMGLESEAKNIFKYLIGTKRGKTFHKRALDKKEYNIEGTTLNYLLCEQENEILCCMYRHLCSIGAQVGAFCFDGMMVKVATWKDKYLKSLEEVVKDQLGYDLQLAIKPMNLGIDLKGLKTVMDIDTSDEALADYILSKKDIMYHSKRKTIYMYDEKSALWKDTELVALRSVISNIAIPLLETIKSEEERAKAINSIKSSNKQGSILKSIEGKIKADPKDSFIDDNFDKVKGIFPIKDNKVILLKENREASREKCHYFTKTTQNELLDEPNEKFVYKYFGDILDTENKEYIEYFLLSLAYSMTGENDLKRFFILQGKKDTGKSLLIKLVNNILGEFGGVGNDKVFKLTKYDSVHDSEAMDLKGRRFISVSELTEEESFNEKLMKKISGGDAINLRGCASEKVNTITFDCVMWLATNDIPNFSGKNDDGVESAFAQRMRVLTFPKVFAIDSKKAQNVISHSNSFFTILCRMAKRYYDNGCMFGDVPEVLASTGKVVDAKDTFKMFWANQTEYEFVVGAKVKKANVFSSYLSWGQGRKLLGRNGFYKRVLQEYDSVITEDEDEQFRFWHGLKGSEFQ